ncbi:MAG: cyanoexosortase B system-associated protein [Spirulina sp.]
MNPLKSESKSLPPRFSLKGRGAKAKLGIVIILLVVMAIAAFPAYLQGQWGNLSISGFKLPVWEIKAPWQKPFPVKNLRQIRSIRTEGIEVAGWETIERSNIQIGGYEWMGQILRRRDRRDVTLFLLPQSGPKQQPALEWVDMDGFFKWNIDSQRPLQFTVKAGETKAEVKARFFLARESHRSPFGIAKTVVVLEWYAWNRGGHYSPVRWFWLDQRAQVHKKRVPWVAVTLRIPVNPNSTLDTARADAEALAKNIQAYLMQNVFSKGNEVK